MLQIIQILRRANGPVTASRMAEELEVSLRTLYRDMASLESTGVPIRGEAGVGYDMPLLMFNASELEALMLGARMLDGRVDTSLSRVAKYTVAKIAAVVPRDLRDVLIDTPLFAPQFVAPQELAIDPELVRRSLRRNSQVDVTYEDLKGAVTERVIWLVLISFFDGATVLAVWCTLRNDFRSFRLDRLMRYDVLDQRLPKPRKTLLVEWKKSEAAAYPKPKVEVRGV